MAKLPSTVPSSGDKSAMGKLNRKEQVLVTKLVTEVPVGHKNAFLAAAELAGFDVNDPKTIALATDPRIVAAVVELNNSQILMDSVAAAAVIRRELKAGVLNSKEAVKCAQLILSRAFPEKQVIELQTETEDRTGDVLSFLKTLIAANTPEHTMIGLLGGWGYSHYRGLLEERERKQLGPPIDVEFHEVDVLDQIDGGSSQ